MLADSKLPTTFWAEAVNTACYVQNRLLVIKPHNKTPNEIFLGRKPALSFMRPFGCPVIILNTIDHLCKFDGKADEGFFVGYSTNSNAFRVFNSRTKIVEENLHVKFSENTPNIEGSGPNWLFDIDALTKSINYKPVVAGNQSNGSASTKACDNVAKLNSKDSPGVGYKPLGEEEKKDAEDPGNEDSEALITEELRVNQEKDNVNNTNTVNAVSSTVNAASNEVNAVGSKWVYRNKMDETGILISNKANLVAQGHTQEEGIEFDEVFAPVARIEAIRLFLAYASFKDFVVKEMCTEFEKMMRKKFQMSYMGDLTFLLGLQVKQKEDGIFISQDNDYAGASSDRISTTEGCQFLGCRLISWQCKKQTMVANSTTEAEYVAALSCYGQVLWIQNQLLNYGYNFMQTKIHIDNESTICIVKNLVFHSKTKHIEIRYHFIRDSNKKKLIQMIKIHTDKNVADLLTKAFDVSRFQYLISIYTLCIERFWTTAKARNINGEAQIHARVDGTKVIIFKASIKRDLRFGDEGGIDCLPNETIFEQLTLMGTIASAVICLATNQKFNFSKYIFDSMVKNLDRGNKILMYPKFVQAFRDKQVDGMSKHNEIYVTPSHTKKSNDPPLSRVYTLRSGEDRLKLNELMELCTKLSERALNLETTKAAQAKEISRLKKRVKRLEKKKKLRTYGLKRLYKGRKIADIDANKRLTLIDETTKDPRRINNEEMFDTDVLNDKEVVAEDVNAASITTAATTAATTVVSIDDFTLAQALVEIKTSKPKTKSIVIFDEQESRRSQVEIDEQDMLAEEKAQLIEDENLAWDNIQAMIDAYFELAARL
nr:retrovirus-related Pol polyprotein from transposon TNT 1-94 [Tanacetum cinerariifolium]